MTAILTNFATILIVLLAIVGIVIYSRAAIIMRRRKVMYHSWGLRWMIVMSLVYVAIVWSAALFGLLSTPLPASIARAGLLLVLGVLVWLGIESDGRY